MANYDYSKLSGKIVEKCRTRGSFAAKMGWSGPTCGRKMNGSTSWSQLEIEKAIVILDINRADIPEYFFALAVTKM